MKTSIIIPCYNAENSIQNTISSILKQKYTDFEIICVDDGSTDSTLKILDDMKLTDKRIVVISQENKGVSAARNTGLDNAKGEYVLFVDSDDEVEPNILEENINLMSNKQYDVLVFGYREIDEVGNSICEKSDLMNKLELNIKEFAEYAEDNNIINAPFNKIYLNRIIQEKDIRFPFGVRIGEDAIFNRNYLMNVNTIGFNPHISYNYLVHSNSAMHSLVDDYNDQTENLLSKVEFLNFFGLDYNMNNFIVNNAFHKMNLAYKQSANGYSQYKELINSFKMYKKAKKIPFYKGLNLQNDKKIKLVLIHIPRLNYYLKKITGK